MRVWKRSRLVFVSGVDTFSAAQGAREGTEMLLLQTKLKLERMQTINKLCLSDRGGDQASSNDIFRTPVMTNHCGARG